jgi:hypothetical protein
MIKNHQQPLTEEQISKALRSAKRAAITLTCIYSPPLLFLTWISCIFFDHPARSSWNATLQIIFFGCCVFIPVPIPIYKTWARYFRMRCKSTRPLLLIPGLYYIFVLYFLIKLIFIELKL